MAQPAHSDSRSNGSTAISVSDLNRAVARLLGQSFGLTWVVGEVSNFTRAASGHCYFSLKDRQAQVRAVMFRSRARAADLTLRNGLKVEVLANLSLYEPRGDFQLTVENLRLAGKGDLHQQFVELKNRLQAEGLFDIERKQVLPAQPGAIGVATSLQAAALQDVLITLKRRAPHIPVVVYPTQVQGDDAPAAIIAALERAAQRAECDVLLLVRGGGSIEDLWAFNAESVARTIVNSTVPVVVGVGHESDVTIADFAADMRAPTPTGAATLVAPERAELLGEVNALTHMLASAWQRLGHRLAQRIDTAWRLLPSPAGQLKAQRQRVAHAARALNRELSTGLRAQNQRVTGAARRLRMPTQSLAQAQLAHQRERLTMAMQRYLDDQARRLNAAAAQLQLVSPQAVLNRGYAIVRDGNDQVLASVQPLATGERLNVLMADGSFDARVDRIRPDSDRATLPLRADDDPDDALGP